MVWFRPNPEVFEFSEISSASVIESVGGAALVCWRRILSDIAFRAALECPKFGPCSGFVVKWPFKIGLGTLLRWVWSS
ncbi:hypothetical protein M0R45_030432 [Rubus argutus]|uniref:Uncharacterized protein n=1 Tax=Rubus argutus TaxID=59490 RepID=A0AAW1WD55_RUBAR